MQYQPSHRRTFLAASAGAIGVAIAGCVDSDPPAAALDDPIAVERATQFQLSSCDCCDEYWSYVEESLDGDLTTEVLDDQQALEDRKADLDVPAHCWSCHTLVIDGIVLEGHLPVEPIAQYLAADRKSIGLSLPGMPAGSPGMGGSKDETWTVYEFFADGTADPFTDVQ